MKKYGFLPIQQAVILTALAATLMLALASPAKSQQTSSLSPPSSGDLGEQSQVNRLDFSEREFAMRNSRMRGSKLTGQAQYKLVYSQIKGDFERIQQLNNRLMNVATVTSSSDLKRIAELTLEVKKSASRLKLNLGLPESQEEEKGQKNQSRYDLDERLDRSIMMLDHSITSFVNNPLFKHGTNVINAQYVTRASSALNSIIEVSESIRKSAEQLSKTSK